MTKQAGKTGLVSYLLLASALFFLQSSCSGSGSNPSPGLSSASHIQGRAFKGPFTKGSQVIARNLATNESVVSAVEDDTGSYRVAVPWSGITEIEIRGLYMDEISGAIAQEPTSLKCVVNASRGVEISSGVNIATTVVALLVEDKISKGSRIDDIDLTLLEQQVAVKIKELLRTPENMTYVSKLELFTSPPQSHLLLAFLLASVLARQSGKSPLAVAEQYAANILAGHMLGEVEPDIPIAVTRSDLERYLTSLKYDYPVQVKDSGRITDLEHMLNNLNIFNGSFRNLFLNALSSGLPAFDTPVPPTYSILYVGPCAYGASTAPPPKVKRGEAITFRFTVGTCVFPSNVPLSMELRINTVPYIVSSRFFTSGPSLCADWMNPKCYPPFKEPNPWKICPANATCTLSQASVTTTTSVEVTLTVQTSGATPLGNHSPHVIGKDVSLGEAGIHNQGWEDWEPFVFTVIEEDPTPTPTPSPNAGKIGIGGCTKPNPVPTYGPVKSGEKITIPVDIENCGDGAGLVYFLPVPQAYMEDYFADVPPHSTVRRYLTYTVAPPGYQSTGLYTVIINGLGLETDTAPAPLMVSDNLTVKIDVVCVPNFLQQCQ